MSEEADDPGVATTQPSVNACDSCGNQAVDQAHVCVVKLRGDQPHHTHAALATLGVLITKCVPTALANTRLKSSRSFSG